MGISVYNTGLEKLLYGSKTKFINKEELNDPSLKFYYPVNPDLVKSKLKCIGIPTGQWILKKLLLCR